MELCKTGKGPKKVLRQICTLGLGDSELQVEMIAQQN